MDIANYTNNLAKLALSLSLLQYMKLVSTHKMEVRESERGGLRRAKLHKCISEKHVLSMLISLSN